MWAWQASGVGSGGGQPLQQNRKADPQTPARQRAAESQALRYSISMNQLKFYNFPSLTKMCAYTCNTGLQAVLYTSALYMRSFLCAAMATVNWFSSFLPKARECWALAQSTVPLPVIPSSVPSLQEESPDGVCAPCEPRRTGRKRMEGLALGVPQLTECLPGIHGTLGSIPSTRSQVSWNRACNINQYSRVRGRRILGYTAS